tara:strand:- start:6142 stop:6555 length:414 start_codon:yes stop_codon:yes gene_type:complete
MQKIFLSSFIIFVSSFLFAAEMSLDFSEKIDISSDNIEIQETKIEFFDNVVFKSNSYEIFGEIAEYDKGMDLIRIKGSPIKFKIVSKDSSFNGFSNSIIIQDDEINISGDVLLESNSSRIKGEFIKLNINSGELQIK